MKANSRARIVHTVPVRVQITRGRAVTICMVCCSACGRTVQAARDIDPFTKGLISRGWDLSAEYGWTCPSCAREVVERARNDEKKRIFGAGEDYADIPTKGGV
jgi:hypothetical protein